MISVQINKILADTVKLKRKLKIKTEKEEILLDAVLSDCVGYFNSEYAFVKCNISDPIIIELCKKSNDIKKLLKNSRECFVVLCTVGKGFHELYEKYLRNNDVVNAFYLDMIASDTVENLAELVSKTLLEKFYEKDKYFLTKRFSPGYGDLKLNEQALIFSLFNAKKISVELTTSFIMIPEKSISYICGVKRIE